MANNRYKNIFSEREYTGYISYMQEYMENFSMQEVFFYKIDAETSKSAVFNESDLNQVAYKDPISIDCFVKINTKENRAYGNNNTGRYEEYGNMEINVLEKTLSEKNIIMEYGDMVAYFIKSEYVFFTIVDADKKNISNEKTFGAYDAVYKTIVATPIPEEQVKYL